MTWVVVRLATAVAVVAAIAAQLSRSLDFAGRDGQRDTANVLINFFSYFTIDSNVLTVVVMLAGALVLLRRRPETHGSAVFRASVTTYMVITGIVYNVLLRNIELAQGVTVAWSNEILHVVAPLVVLVDWCLAPGRHALPARDALLVVAFPVVWAVYTLVRGPFATDPYAHTGYWYPYPFINPVTASGGYGTVAIYVVVLTFVFVGVAAGVLWISRRYAVRAPSGVR